MIKSILIVEDEQNVAAFIQKGLTEAGYIAFVAHEGETALDLLQQIQVDLILLDIILPGINGFDLAKKIKTTRHANIPIIFLTALGTTDNIVKGLDIGADDYLVKPFKFKELLARIRVLSRRNSDSAPIHSTYQIADLILDDDLKSVQRAGIEIKLTSTEYRLLKYLIVNQNKVLSRIDILEHVWEINFNMGTNVVDVYVNYLRNKIDKNFDPKLIHTVIGMGYVLKSTEE